jgi:hypothetical protein
MAPRGLKAALKKSSPAVLVGTGRFKAFSPLRQGKKTGRKLRGLTKRLEKKAWSSGTLPMIAKRSNGRAGGHWLGKNGGRKRGTKVDAQLTRLINAGPSAMKNALHVYRLTKMVLAGLASKGLEPVAAQRPVISETHRIGTAADIVAYSKKTNKLVMVELKTGFDTGRTAAALNSDGKACKMQAPLSGAWDCNAHRHLAQLAVTRELFVREKSTLDRLGELGLEREVDGMLMYANDEGVEFFELTEWWVKRGGKLLNAIA